MRKANWWARQSMALFFGVFLIACLVGWVVVQLIAKLWPMGS